MRFVPCLVMSLTNASWECELLVWCCYSSKFLTRGLYAFLANVFFMCTICFQFTCMCVLYILLNISVYFSVWFFNIWNQFPAQRILIIWCSISILSVEQLGKRNSKWHTSLNFNRHLLPGSTYNFFYDLHKGVSC